MVLPPAVAGIGLLMAFGRRGLLGPTLESAGLSVGFTTAAVVLAQLFVAAPFYVRAARAGFIGVDRDLEDVARTYGASDFETFWRVTVPLSLPSLLAGASMCWARALGEFGATIMFAGQLPGPHPDDAASDLRGAGERPGRGASPLGPPDDRGVRPAGGAAADLRAARARPDLMLRRAGWAPTFRR